MTLGASFPATTPPLEQWRPEKLSWSDAGWCGAALGLVGHAALHFFSVPIPSLERLLIVFQPAERFAYAITANTAPIATWLVMLATQAAFWALAGVAVLAAAREAVWLVRRVS